MTREDVGNGGMANSPEEADPELDRLERVALAQHAELLALRAFVKKVRERLTNV